jgi:cytochrome c
MSASGPRRWIIATALAAAGIGPSVAADGAALFKAKACDSCHGENGAHPITADYPVLAGQNASYLLRQMIDIRDGKRTNGLASNMKAVVGEVTDEELAAIAAWLAQQF